MNEQRYARLLEEGIRAAGLSLERVAQACSAKGKDSEISTAYLSRVLRGKAEPTLRRAVNMALGEVLGIDGQELQLAAEAHLLHTRFPEAVSVFGELTALLYTAVIGLLATLETFETERGDTERRLKKALETIKDVAAFFEIRVRDFAELFGDLELKELEEEIIRDLASEEAQGDEEAYKLMRVKLEIFFRFERTAFLAHAAARMTKAPYYMAYPLIRGVLEGLEQAAKAFPAQDNEVTPGQHAEDSSKGGE